jgi:hypothetical protein
MSEQEIQQMIKDKGLNAPRVTPDMVEAAIDTVQYVVIPGTSLTICTITLWNGCVVTGESACLSQENFDEELGQKVAYGKARDKIWGLEAYRMMSERALAGG